MSIIIDAKYGNSDLNKFMTKKFQHINATECYRILNLLIKFEYLFEGTLGIWNTNLVYLDLKNNVKNVCSRTYLLLRVQ